MPDSLTGRVFLDREPASRSLENALARATAMRADTGDLDHRRLWRETRGARGRFHRAGELFGSCLADRAALVAQQEHHRIAGIVTMDAGDERVAAFDAVDQSLLAQEIQRPVNRDRRRGDVVAFQPVNDLVGAEGTMARQQRLEDVAPDRRQPLRPRRAQRFRMRQGIGRATVMIVVGSGKNRSFPGHGTSLSGRPYQFLVPG